MRKEAVNLVKYRGWSMRKVARRFGVEPSTVSRWCKHPLGNGWFRIPTAPALAKTHPNALNEALLFIILRLFVDSDVIRRLGLF